MLSSFLATRFPALGLSRERGSTHPIYKDTVAQAEEPSDESLIGRICADDHEALGVLFRRYARLVWSIAHKILRDPEEAEDVTQELFLSIRRKAHVFDSNKGPARTLIVHMSYQHAIS